MDPLAWLAANWALLVALALLVVGVVGSVVPAIPGAVLSLVGVLVYWWSTGFAEPGTLALAGFVAAGLFAVAADHLGGAVAARVGGASPWTSAAAGVVGFLLFFVAGPVGVLLGVAGTVFALEYYRHREARRGLETALYTTVGMLASTAVQVVVTLSMLVGFVLVLVV